MISCYLINKWVIPCKITHSKNESLPNVFILSTQSVHPIRFHNPEYQSPVTSGSRVTGCTNRQLAKTGQLQLDMTFLFVILFSYKKSFNTHSSYDYI